VEPVSVQCPFCGELIELLVDVSVLHQQYVEDCEVCCRPVNVSASVDASGLPSVEVSR
jgi:hypothetical protein